MDEKKEEKEVKEKASRFQELIKKSSKNCAEILIDRLNKEGVDVAAFEEEIAKIVESAIVSNHLLTAILVM